MLESMEMTLLVTSITIEILDKGTISINNLEELKTNCPAEDFNDLMGNLFENFKQWSNNNLQLELNARNSIYNEFCSNIKSIFSDSEIVEDLCNLFQYDIFIRDSETIPNKIKALEGIVPKSLKFQKDVKTRLLKLYLVNVNDDVDTSKMKQILNELKTIIEDEKGGNI